MDVEDRFFAPGSWRRVLMYSMGYCGELLVGVFFGVGVEYVHVLTVTRVSQPPAAAPAAMLIVVDGLLMLYLVTLAAGSSFICLCYCKKTISQYLNLVVYQCIYVDIYLEAKEIPRDIVLTPLYPPSSPPHTSHPRPPAPGIPTTAPPASW